MEQFFLATTLTYLLVTADIRNVDFVVKTIPAVTYSNTARKWISGDAWVPSFTYAYVYKNKEYISTWSPRENFISGDAYELVTPFNKDFPTEKFVTYWKNKTVTDTIYTHVQKNNPSDAYLTLGELSTKERNVLNSIGIIISLIALSCFVYFNFFK
jgi:hypothetical protein